MNLQESVLFYILIVLFIAKAILIFVNKKFRTWQGCFLVAVILVALVYLSQEEGALTYKIGSLEATIQKNNNSTRFKIENPTNAPVKETIRFSSNSTINNVVFKKGNDFFSLVGGGVGNKYIVYNVEIPANKTASGAVVSIDTAILAPLFDKNDLVREE